ncbi:DUF305 domain-containing protein [Pseudonocardia saturnea]|uniref:DUF305 domain-containing protein n=1 Tax=Pseudonocardia saturnea TaxID=33909 RepID=UPI0014772464|nr:DUF305 domain-containing protein [Pseudonocardia saturnea]
MQFVKMMVPHHQQALRMAEIVLAKPDLNPQVRRMTEKIQREQGPEIEKMQSWLAAWNAGPAMSLEQAQGMQGLLSPAPRTSSSGPGTGGENTLSRSGVAATSRRCT